ncbi:DUF3558 domain-containing protein [Actinosynnema sp. NPDC050436]|uniref:DUF3558 domain-containing protein n=1 Tax=Actinosynnema sp. NPDC050436 TaxID=3155659 RepID=UPI0033D73AF8
MRLAKGIVAALVATAAVSACTSGSTGGTATPATQTTSSDAPTTTSKAPSTRPKEIKLDGVDPCTLLTSAQQAELKIDEAESDPAKIIQNTTSPSCSYTNNSAKAFGYHVTLVTTEGIGYWDGSGNLDVSPKTVAGYDAAQIFLKGTSTGDCSITLDVADGQQLYVQFLPLSPKAFTQDEMCQNATKGAESALSTLRTLK